MQRMPIFGLTNTDMDMGTKCIQNSPTVYSQLISWNPRALKEENMIYHTPDKKKKNPVRAVDFRVKAKRKYLGSI